MKKIRLGCIPRPAQLWAGGHLSRISFWKKTGFPEQPRLGFTFAAPMRRILLLLFCGVCMLCFAQPRLAEVKGLPTKEVFDLLVDRKGFLWVGHDMGLSRYDGVSFTHFAHPKRSSLSVTDLVEDRFGRIWFHNFTGQIFYVEDDRVDLLEAYQNEAEDYFPRMVLCGDELVVTSRFGLFVCDTRTLESRYVRKKAGRTSGTKSLAVLGAKVVAQEENEWFVYTPETGLELVPFQGEDAPFYPSKTLMLQPQTTGDTAYLTVNPTGTLLKITLNGTGLHHAGLVRTEKFINTVTSDRGVFWLHTRTESAAIRGGAAEAPFQGLNLSDIVTDHQGNRWLSSLEKGLLVAPVPGNSRLLVLPFLKPGENISAMAAAGKVVLAGTNTGQLYAVDFSSKKVVWKKALSKDMGSVNMIHSIDDQHWLVSTSSGTLFLNKQTFQQKPFTNFIVNGAFILNNRIIVTSSTGLYNLPYGCSGNLPFQVHLVSLHQWNGHWLATRQGKPTFACNSLLQVNRRSRSLAFTGQELYASFMDGVYRMDAEGAHPLVLSGARIYANALVAHDKKLYIGTLNAGMIIKSAKGYERITTDNGLFSNSIIRLKQQGRYLWIFLDQAIQLMDLQTGKLENDIELPQESGANVHDVVAVGDTAWLATNNGFYQVFLRHSVAHQSVRSYLQAVVVNNTTEKLSSGAVLKNNQNNIQFQLAIPFYSPNNMVYFKYRLKGGVGQNQWYATQQGERIIRFASLTPGAYTFEAVAVVGGSQQGRPVRFAFTISRPRWQTAPFILLGMALMALAFYGVYRYRMRQLLKIERVRRSISSDLHDEIGSTLSSINIYSEMARTEKESHTYLDLIQENTREVIGKLDDLVWSINPKNDSMVQLVARMRSFAEPVLKGAGIQCSFKVNEQLLLQELPLETKRNLYLIFKELVANVVKHSKASHCQVHLQWANGQVALLVADDGIGIKPGNEAADRSGLSNLQSRARKMKAFLYFQDNGEKGTAVRVIVPVKKK